MASGIDGLISGKRVLVPEQGLTGELGKKLNQAAAVLDRQRWNLEQRDTARTEWISGVSHDIRTPLSMVMGYMEVFVFPVNAITANGEMWFFLIPASFFLFYFITHMELKDRKIYGKLRELSMMFYYLHMLVNFGYRCMIKALELLWKKDLVNMFVQYLVVVAVSLLLSEAVLRLSRTQKFSWLKILY